MVDPILLVVIFGAIIAIGGGVTISIGNINIGNGRSNDETK